MKATGCPYIVGTHGKGLDSFSEFCNRIPAEGSLCCPKHTLMVAEEALEPERIKERARQTRAANKAKAETLKNSPLKAFNPEFDKPEETGYSR